MNRVTLLLFGGILILGLIGYWMSGREKADEYTATSPEVTKEYNTPEKEMPKTETTPVSPQTDTLADEEDMPKPVSENQKKFESEEDTPDTDDSVTVEVELEEE